MDLTLINKIKSQKKLLQIFKFGMTGMSGLIIDFSITWFCKDYMGWDKYIANVCGFSIAVINNYFLNRTWTFKSSEKKIAKQFSTFLFISMAGLMINTSCLFLIHDRLQISFYPAKALAILIVFVWNYTANSRLTFKQQSAPQ